MVYTLLHLNVRSVINKICQLEAALEGVKPSFLCLTETWTSDYSVETVQIQGYKLVSQYSRTKRLHGGVAMLAEEGSAESCTPVDWIAEFSEEMHFESAGMLYRGAICVVTIYRSSNSREYNLFFNKFEQLISRVTSKYKAVVVCGDLNIHGEDTKDRHSKHIIDVLQAYGMENHVREPTRYVGGIGSQLDYIISNLNNVFSCKVIELGLSDHAAQSVAWCGTEGNLPVSSGEEYVLRRFFNTEAIDEFRYRFSRGPLLQGDGTGDVNSIFQTFWSHFMHCFGVCFPERRVKRHSNSKLVFKYSRQLLRCCENLKLLNWLKKVTDDYQIRELYIDCNRQLKEKIIMEKRCYYNRLIEGASNKARTYWQIVNFRRGRKKATSTNISLITEGGIIREGPEVANEFGRYFTTVVGQQLRTEYHTLSTSCTKGGPLGFSMFFRPVSGEEVVGIIGGMKTGTSCGIDEVPVALLKTCRYDIADHMANLINVAVTRGEFPDELKLAKSIVIHKKGDRQITDNYRLITLMSPFSKIIEKAVSSRILDFLNKFKILTDCQYGFRVGLSTETATTAFTQCVNDKLEANEYVVGITFDLSRAFDTLNPGFVAEKLHAVGIRGPVNDFLFSFLTGRRIRVAVGGALSERYEVPLGTPQGSVLGPLLFLIYVNDLPNYVTHGRTFMYADDTSVVISHKDSRQVNAMVNKVLLQFKNWCEKNHLIVNLSKTKYIQFTGPHRSPLDTYQIGIGNEAVDPADSITFLGTLIDSRLRWSDQIDRICKRINSYAYVISNLKTLFDRNKLLSAYYGLVYPILSYNIISWGRATDVDRVFIAQKRVLRVMFGLTQTESCRTIFKDTKIMTVTSLYMYRILCYIHEQKDRFRKRGDIHEHHTRSNRHLQLPKVSHLYYKKSPDYAGGSLYNRLPERLKTLSIRQFRETIKGMLTSRAFYSESEFLTEMPGS